MAISDISLTTGMRSNLLALQSTTAAMNQTQNRLSTGKKVNSALDNPTNFFSAQSHLQRASDLSDRKDGMSEGIQTVKAADAGIKAITALIQAAKGLVSSAYGNTDVTARKDYSEQFDALLDQIDTIAEDSGYKGTNLLGGDILTVEFSQYSGDATLVINGFVATTDSTATPAGELDIAKASKAADATNGTDWATNANIKTSADALDAAQDILRSQSSSLASSLTVITTRQEFTNTMINTLQTGADNLTLADMNEEGANMLMLQTRQSLSTTALSLSSQAAQSVLRLFG
ncbi:flagellin [Geomonas sp. RF6]|uniref:flagellin N-terminal helical domain-containing protein n=1 Tax=Geomonas sp. RF6 TaxID=2897342 RepID=UPI001E463643|nr:flagellin [Geomonas sp. RF6]UFS70567.1 flagellin [Geomonas sp. RF6]